MAYASTPRAASGVFETLRTLFASLRDNVAQRSIYNRTYKELSRLSERELADIGLHRCDIKAACTDIAYK